MSKVDEIKQLLIKTVNNHHQYQESNLKGEYNINWSDWYAKYLIENGLEELWGREISQDELAAMLTQLDADYNSEEREMHWPGYYAERLVQSDQ